MRNRTYQTPRLVELGSVAELTQGERRGDVLDADFPAGTPVGDLTFS